jgi:flagellar motor switch/type III secretory pathway protein FliN
MTRQARPWLPAGALTAPDFIARLNSRINAWARRWLVDASLAHLSCEESDAQAFDPETALLFSNVSGEVCIGLDREGALALATAMLSSKPKRRYPPADKDVMLQLARVSLVDLLRETAIFFGASQTPAEGSCTESGAQCSLRFTASSPSLPPISLHVDRDLAIMARTSAISSQSNSPNLKARSEAIAGQTIRVGARLGAGRVSLSELYGLGQGDVLKIDRHEGPLPLTINGETKPSVFCEPYREGSILKLRLIEEHAHP